ncbi:hypothetical protein [Runella sp.]|jgi:uncharacterized membrane protein|uniref:hypothetical protein n=1 Tax=Runella sp. TaxID=1960881 RepID=UPI0026312521|nr:hypothetical protein [Runella sp.]
MINQTHLHLLITHLPIFGSLFGGLVLAYGLWTKSDQTKTAAYILFIISSIGAGIAYLTGEAAEETVENIQGVVESTIKQHEDFALISLIALIALGVFALIGLFLTVKKSPLTRPVAIITFLISLVSFGLIARTGYLGGQIRHTEISSNPTNPTENSERESD